ncbi:hypothetical protein HanIR_Chr03g0105991 [Helianthus annuus]|nr:hypothetical protein HanIR_Chr03g0105991 [Helianthus annuus]
MLNERCGCVPYITLTRPTRPPKLLGGLKGLVAYAKCNRDSYESEFGLLLL